MFLTYQENKQIKINQYTFTKDDFAFVRKKYLEHFISNPNHLKELSAPYSDQNKLEDETTLNELLLQRSDDYWEKENKEKRLKALEELGTNKDLIFINGMLQSISGKTKKETNNEIGSILDDHNLAYLGFNYTEKSLNASVVITVKGSIQDYFKIKTLNILILLMLKFDVVYSKKDKSN